MLQVSGVSYSYAGHTQEEPPALAEVTLEFTPGQLVALLGHNGSGKTTLAKLISGVLRPQAGSVLVEGFDTRDREGIWEVRRRVGLVFQQPDDQLVTNTVLDDIAFGPENLGLPRSEIEARLAEVVPLLELDPYVGVPINELSIGQKQRVAIAGVLAMRPRYMLLDEPTSMLPPQLARQLLATITRLAREQDIGVIYITHYMDEVTGFDRAVVIDQGHIVLDGTPRSVFGARERMRALGLDIPLATEINARLRARGLRVPEMVLTDDELVGALRQVAPPVPGRAEAAHTSAAAASSADAKPLATSETEPPLLRTRKLSHIHLKGTPFAQVGLAGLDMEVPRGSFIACVGPTRSGKSTLVDCLNGIIRPGREMVFFLDQDIAASGFDMEKLRAAVGVVYQSPESQIFNDIVGKDVAFGPLRQKISLAESRRRVQESLEAVGLPYEDFRNRYTYALSGGQKRRVAIAGVLAMNPDVLVLDEPTAGLDPRGRAEFLALIRWLRAERGLTVVYMTSSMEDVADLASYIYVLDAGRVAFSGVPRDILRRLDDLDALQVGLSSVSRLALALQRLYPELATDCLDAAELERELLRHIPRASPDVPPGADWPRGEEQRHD